MADTWKGGTRTAPAVALLLALSMASGAAAASGPAGSARAPLNARVIWAHAGRAYLASNDPLPIQEGDLLTFQSGKKNVAAGTVGQVLDGTLAIVRMTSGSLEGVKKLDRLLLFAERPRLRPVNVLRIGIPSRSNLLFACATPSVRSPLPRAGFRGEAMSIRSFLLTRDTSDAETAMWPDTLRVRLFDESTDQEIALERGELDVAVFWPGELSTHMREDPKWRDLSYGARARGVLAAVPSEDGPGMLLADSLALYDLNSGSFRGDLLAWDPAARRTAAQPQPQGASRSQRFEVDRACPGWQALERALNQKAPPNQGSEHVIRVSYFGTPAQASAPAGFTFAIRCPVVGSPGLRKYLDTLGADAFAGMVDCAIARGGR